MIANIRAWKTIENNNGQVDYETDWSMLEEGPGLEQSVVIPNAASKSDIPDGELGICCIQCDSTTQLSLGFI